MIFQADSVLIKCQGSFYRSLSIAPLVSAGPRFEIVDSLVSPSHISHILSLFVGDVFQALLVVVDEESKECISTQYRESRTQDDEQDDE